MSMGPAGPAPDGGVEPVAEPSQEYDRGPYAAFAGHIGTTVRDSIPWWRAPPRPGPDAPNVVVVLVDDLGYSDFGCFGGEIRTPTIDRLAAGGLRFTGYTTVPMCTPARAALLTGKNPHSVGSGWLTSNWAGYPGYQAGEISHDVPTLAEVLVGAGYRTMAVGKWHNTPPHLASRTADRYSWPTHRGFQRFYGFLAAETSYFKPHHLVEGDEFVDRDDYPEDYYTTDEWTDRAIGYVKEHLAGAPDQPFFLYLAENAPHMPLQVKAEHRGAYRGRYDAGWDALREERFARQRQSGLVDDRHRIPQHTPNVPEWGSLSTEERQVCARYMELYASVVEAIDSNLGRLVDFLEAAGALSNTMIMITSDNGANAVGGPYGNPNQFAARYGLSLAHDDPRVLSMVEEDRLGDAETAPAYPAGWAEASNTPFRMFKRTTMNGGIRVPLVVSWPDRVARPGATRADWVHVTDLLPTVLDVAGVAYPGSYRGLPTRAIDGASFAPLLTEADPAHHRRPRQHYELQANRGMIDGDWKIVSLQPPDAEMDLDNWMLFDLATDPSETENLAAREPGILARLVAAFDEDAKANWVYPLDNRSPRRNVSIPPPLAGISNAPRFFHPGTPTVGVAVVGALVADRDYVVRAGFEHEPGHEGVVFALGDSMSGFSLYVLDGTLRFAVARWPEPAAVAATAVPAGPVSFEMAHTARGRRQGSARLTVNGQDWATVDVSPTFARPGGGLDVGRDRGHQVSHEYAGRVSFPYTGAVAGVAIEPGPQAPGTIVNMPEAASQHS